MFFALDFEECGGRDDAMPVSPNVYRGQNRLILSVLTPIIVVDTDV